MVEALVPAKSTLSARLTDIFHPSGIFYHNYAEMKEAMEKYRKLEEVKNGDFTKLPEYFVKEKSIERVRMAYRIRSKMVTDIKMNFKNSYKGDLKCDWCDSEEDESQCHVIECIGWEEERRGLDLYVMGDLVTFFQRILKEKGDKRKEGLV